MNKNMERITSWDKFRLLIWKNWRLQRNQKSLIFTEIVLPVVLSLFLVYLRFTMVAEPKPVTTYKPQEITNINLFKSLLPSHIGTDSTVVYKLGYSPKNPVLEKIVQEAANSLKLLDIVGYNTASQMQIALELNGFIAGVQFDDNWNNIIDYPVDFSFALRFPSELRTVTENPPLTWMTNQLFMPLDLTGPRNVEHQDGGVPVGYLREAFLPIQNAITMAYMKQVTGNNDLPSIHMQRYPYPEYIYDPLLAFLPHIMPMIILFSFMYPCTHIVTNITAEKEKQLKEVMKIMGLNNWVHWAAWFVNSFIMLFISAILITALMKIRLKNDVAVLTYIDWKVLLLFLSVYVITSICFCFMIATFFSRASIAAVFAPLISLVCYFPYQYTIHIYNDLSLGTKLGWCLLSNSAMGFAFKLIIEFEGTGEGIQWSNLFTPVNIDDNLTVGHIILMMLASCVICICICLYVEQIFPGEFGVPKKWYFIFTKQFWCGERNYIGIKDIPNGPIERHNPDAFEPEPTGKNVGIQVKNLKKKFGNKMAVNGLSFNMYEDEITVLLGHNGAGKTTTISMLTGMFPPTAGTAIINGSDIRTNIEGARMSLGLCPQHNVLFDNLTVAEHLIFFSRLKGLKGDDIQKEVDKYLRMIELEDKADVASKKLSGGMKRKLSVCCALTGTSKVVLCDEPSSGMDPSARRQLWNILQSEKMGRCLLLTTHLMDEADVLGDRIAIMCDGELKCHGTSFFLKKKYGTGYRLICEKREGCVVDKITALLQKYIPGIQPEADIGAELSYQLPDMYSNRFEKMFSSLEDQSNDLKLNGYGIGISSLEEVFMRVGAENANNGSRKQASAIMNVRSGYPGDDTESITHERLFSENARLLKGANLLNNQWHAMILKKFLYTYRNKLLFLLQNIIPIFFVTMIIINASSKGTFNQLKPLTMSLTQYPMAVTVLDTANDVAVDTLPYRIAEKYRNIATSYGSDYKLLDTGDKSFSEFILDLGRKIQARINSRYLASATIRNENIIAWLNNKPLHTAPLTINLVHNAMIKALMNDLYRINVTNAPLPYKSTTALQQLNTGNNLGTQLSLQLCFCFCFVSAFYILFLIKERASRSKLLQFVGGVKVWTFWLSQLVWDIITFALTAIIVIATIACWQEKGFSSFDDLARYFLILMLFGISVLPLTYIVSFLFTEPTTGFTYVTLLNTIVVMVLLFLLMFDYVDKKTTELVCWFLRIFPHFSLGMALSKLYLNAATRKTCSNKILDSFPPAIKCQMYPQCCKTIGYFAWEEPGVLPEIVYMAVTAVVFFLITIILEYKLFDKLIYEIKQSTFKPPPPPHDGYFDDDVDQEKQRIVNMTRNELSATNLVLDRVTKYYDKFLAVNQVSLCVKPIECFGLLGVNGAGKTTTFKMMTGDERITFGRAYVKGLNLSTDLNKIYKEIGYCPQFDALLEDLTGRETLKIFCLLRGIHKERIPNITEELAKSFGFTKHLDKPTKAYSGGNKRKLSTAISVIGSPSVIYLDEPTTGMDPAARRQLWNMVCRIRDSGKSIVLTSHSMEECEALCTRLAIMVNGEFKCIGSTQHLKNKFSKGLILKIKVRRNTDLEKAASNILMDADETSVPTQMLEQDINSLKAFVETEFPQAILQEEYQGILTFYIPLSSIKWSKIFGLMERNRDALNVEDYSISQTTLEEIFLDFAKYQREDARPVKSSNTCSLCGMCCLKPSNVTNSSNPIQSTPTEASV